MPVALEPDACHCNRHVCDPLDWCAGDLALDQEAKLTYTPFLQTAHSYYTIATTGLSVSGKALPVNPVSCSKGAAGTGAGPFPGALPACSCPCWLAAWPTGIELVCWGAAIGHIIVEPCHVAHACCCACAHNSSIMLWPFAIMLWSQSVCISVPALWA